MYHIMIQYNHNKQRNRANGSERKDLMKRFTKVSESGEYISIFAYDTVRKYLQYKLDEIDACEKLEISIGGEDFFDDFHDYLEAQDRRAARAVGLTDEEIDSKEVW